MTLAHDLIQFNSAYGVELIAHIFRVFPKAQLFAALRNQGGITWCKRNFFRLRWAFSLNQPSLIVGWPFYNSKNSKPNRSASQFGRRNKKTFNTFELLSELPIPPVPWPDLVFAVALVGSFSPPVKMDLLPLLPLKAVVLPHLPQLCLLSPPPPLLLLYPWITSYSSNSWRPT